MAKIATDTHFLLVDYPRAPRPGRESFAFRSAWHNLKRELQNSTGIAATISTTPQKNQLCISFSELADAAAGPDLQKFVNKFSRNCVAVMPDNPVQQMIFSRDFPGL